MPSNRQLSNRAVLGLGLIGIGASVASALLPTFEIGLLLVGGAIAAGALIHQYRSSQPTVIEVSNEDWRLTPDGEERQMRVEARTHGKGRHPSVSVWEVQPEGSFQEVLADVHTDVDGNVTVNISRGSRLEGQIRIS